VPGRSRSMAPMSNPLANNPARGGRDAPDRCETRARRLIKVKFMALPMPMEPQPAPTALALLFSRVLGFLAVARR